MYENYYEKAKLEFINIYLKSSLDGYYFKSELIGEKCFFEYNKEVDIYYYNNEVNIVSYDGNMPLSFERVIPTKLEKVLIDKQQWFNEKDLDNVINKLIEEIEESELKVFVFKLELNDDFNNNILLTYVIK